MSQWHNRCREYSCLPPSQNLLAESSTSPMTCMCPNKIMYPMSSPVIPLTLDLTSETTLLPFEWSNPELRARDCLRPCSAHQRLLCSWVNPIVHFLLDRLERKTHCESQPHKIHYCPSVVRLIRLHVVSHFECPATHTEVILELWLLWWQPGYPSKSSLFRHVLYSHHMLELLCTISPWAICKPDACLNLPRHPL